MKFVLAALVLGVCVYSAFEDFLDYREADDSCMLAHSMGWLALGAFTIIITMM